MKTPVQGKLEKSSQDTSQSCQFVFDWAQPGKSWKPCKTNMGNIYNHFSCFIPALGSVYWWPLVPARCVHLWRLAPAERSSRLLLSSWCCASAEGHGFGTASGSPEKLYSSKAMVVVVVVVVMLMMMMLMMMIVVVMMIVVGMMIMMIVVVMMIMMVILITMVTLIIIMLMMMMVMMMIMLIIIIVVVMMMMMLMMIVVVMMIIIKWWCW